MAAQPQTVNLLDSLSSEINFTDIGHDEEILLTPYLTLACALLYMMASDGHLGEQESSHLQGVLGGDDKVLAYGLRYVQTVPIDKFLIDAPEVLSAKDKWCILTNVSDALLSDGHVDDEELVLLSRLVSAFGVPEKKFQQSIQTLKLKNDKTILGRYTGVKAERQAMTPHFALAASLLYMLTADGTIGAEEIGQLEAVIGEFEGLQNVALKYVRSVKLKPFLEEASASLNQEQKLYILTNVCDSMLSDGSVARLEDKVFISMVQAFGFNEKTFEPYYQVLECKNFKPFECSFKNRAVHQFASATDPQKVDANAAVTSANQGVWELAASDLASSNAISRTMQENIQSVKDSFGTQDSVTLVGLNATDGLNVQKIELDDSLNNKQKVALDLDDEANRQKVAQDELTLNRQLLGQVQASPNKQSLPADVKPSHVELIDAEVRLQNIHEVVGKVNERLDHFERQHFSFLQVGRGVRYDDSFAPIVEAKVEVNRQRVDRNSQELGDVQLPSSLGLLAQSVPSANDVSRQVLASATPSEASVLSFQTESPIDKGVQLRSGAGFETRSSGGQVSGIRKVSSLHLSRLNYLQLVMAFATLMFAAPISTKTSLSRIAVGPLVFVSQDQAADPRDLN